MECNDYPQKNPNLYIELAASGQGGYIETEASGILLTEASDNFITQNG